MKKGLAQISRQAENGFTIIEIGMVMVILTSILVIVTASMIYFFQSYNFSFEQYQSVSSAQTGMGRMSRDIRESRTGENGAWPIVNAGDTSFSFYSDITNDGRADLVRYFVAGTDLKKGIIEPSGAPVSYPPASEKVTIVASGLANGTTPLFTYYNGNWPADTAGNPLPLANRVVATRYVKIYMKIDPNPATSTGGFELNSGVEIRSMKDNL
jgi:type II secretory pathway pseudopilin PulG